MRAFGGEALVRGWGKCKHLLRTVSSLATRPSSGKVVRMGVGGLILLDMLSGEENILHSDQDLSQAPESIGVALSGGGVRAAFFALGALLYLVHSGLHRNISLISSVSGGSIVNVALAIEEDLTKTDAVRFGRFVGKASKRMAGKGVFFWPGMKPVIALFLILASLPFLLLAIFTLGSSGPIDDTGKELVWVLEIFYLGFLFPLFPLSIILLRQSIQQSAYQTFLNEMSNADDRSKRRTKKLSDLPFSTVSHVVCATELTSGQPFYMSRDMVFSPLYGRGKPDILLPKVIYASAAFPIAFPPLRVITRDLGVNGGRDDDCPRALMLSDGGVFNNLGTETFSANDDSAQIFLPDPSLPIIPRVDRQLVVNASSPPKKTRLKDVPFWSFFKTSTRIMSVLYESTLRPRIQKLMENQLTSHGPIVIDISESPIELVDRLRDVAPATGDTAKRASSMRSELNKVRSDHEWKVYADLAAGAKTALSAVGGETASRLLHLGYLDMSISCHAHFGTLGIGHAPPDKWFKELVDNKLSDEELSDPAAMTTVPFNGKESHPTSIVQG